MARHPLLHIGRHAEGEAEREAEPPPQPHHPEHRIGRQRVCKGNDQHIEVEHRAGVLCEQADKPDKDVVDQVVVRVILARDLIERPAERAGQLAIAALHLPDPVDAVTAVKHRCVPVQTPQLEEPVFTQGHRRQQQRDGQNFPGQVLF